MADLILIVPILLFLAKKFDRLAVLDVGRGLLRLEFHVIPSEKGRSDKPNKRKELK